MEFPRVHLSFVNFFLQNVSNLRSLIRRKNLKYGFACTSLFKLNQSMWKVIHFTLWKVEPKKTYNIQMEITCFIQSLEPYHYTCHTRSFKCPLRKVLQASILLKQFSISIRCISCNISTMSSRILVFNWSWFWGLFV